MLEHWFKESKLTNNLNNLIELYNDVDLSNIHYCITDKEAKLSKKQGIKKVLKLLDKDNIYTAINNLINDEFKILENILDNNGIIEVDDNIVIGKYLLLRNRGIYYFIKDNDKYYVIIPDQILQIIKKFDLEELRNQIQKNTRLYDLAISMINLYGVCTFENYVLNCMDYLKYEDAREINILSIVDNGRFNPIIVYNLDGVECMTFDSDLDFDYSFLSDKLNNLNLFEIAIKDVPLQEVLKYKDPFYHEDIKEIKEFKKYFLDKGYNEDNINELTEELVNLIRKNYQEAILFLEETFRDHDIDLKEENIDDILMLISKIYNNIPIWGNNGWTNKELILNKSMEDS